MRDRSAVCCLAGLLMCLLLVVVATAVTAQPRPPEPPAVPPFRAVLIAGDGGLDVFDNGVAAMAAWLRRNGAAAPDHIMRFSASPAVIAWQHAASASSRHVLRAIERLKPPPGQGCFVFITSHGIRNDGVLLSYDNSVLYPAALDHALTAGCGMAPTVAIISACYSGSFARWPMARANRIVLTAARADRASFGCSADETFTYFDRCLMQGLGHGPRWRDAFAATRDCVEQRESREQDMPSLPQAWFGREVADLPLPGTRTDDGRRDHFDPHAPRAIGGAGARGLD